MRKTLRHIGTHATLLRSQILQLVAGNQT